MRFPLRALAAAGVLALIGSTASLAADTTQSAQAPADNQQLVDMVRDLQIRLDKDEMALRSMQNELPKTTSSSHLFCGDGYDPGRDACN